MLSKKKKKVGPSSECSQIYRLYFSTCIYRCRGFGTVSVITARFSNSAMWRGAHQPLIYGGWRVCTVCMWVFACMAYLCGVFARVPSYCIKHAQLFHCSLPCSLQELWYCMLLLKLIAAIACWKRTVHLLWASWIIGYSLKVGTRRTAAAKCGLIPSQLEFM